ncbi:MAG: hypothetical protein HUU37_09070, partial [Bdellovibrionales bacterium]|nr:hypothetical protein [Bdellovibrionales bacterium]
SIPERRTYTRRLERELIKKGAPAEVIGLGASDFSTTQELLVYDRIGEQFSADIVGIQFFALNDFINNEISFANRNQGRGDFMRPYAAPDGTHRIWQEVSGLGITYLSPVKKWWRDHVHLARVLSTLYHWLRWKLPLPSPGCTNELRLFVVEKDEDWRRAIGITERILRAFKARVEWVPDANPSQRYAKGSPRLLLFHFVSPHEVNDRLWNEAILPQLRSCFPGKSFSPREGERLVHELGRKVGIPTFSLRQAFHEHVSRGIDLYLPDGHLNEKGNELAANALAPFFHSQVKSMAPRKQR